MRWQRKPRHPNRRESGHMEAELRPSPCKSTTSRVFNSIDITHQKYRVAARVNPRYETGMRNLGPQRERPSTSQRAFWQGFFATLPLQVATLPFGMLFGIVAVETGLDPAQIAGFTLIVLAGASSLVAMELIQEQVPAMLVILTGAVVNLRMAIYSAALVPHWEGAGWWPRFAAGYFLNDQTYAVPLRAYETDALPGLRERLAYFFGSGFCCIPCWSTTVLLGVMLGAQVPESWGLEMATPALFLALAAPMVRTPAHAVAMAVAMGSALLVGGLPKGLDVISAAGLGIMAGCLMARVTGREVT